MAASRGRVRGRPDKALWRANRTARMESKAGKQTDARGDHTAKAATTTTGRRLMLLGFYRHKLEVYILHAIMGVPDEAARSFPKARPPLSTRPPK